MSIVRPLCLEGYAFAPDVSDSGVEKTCRMMGTCRGPSEVEQNRDEEASTGMGRVEEGW